MINTWGEAAVLLIRLESTGKQLRHICTWMPEHPFIYYKLWLTVACATEEQRLVVIHRHLLLLILDMTSFGVSKKPLAAELF